MTPPYPPPKPDSGKGIISDADADADTTTRARSSLSSARGTAPRREGASTKTTHHHRNKKRKSEKRSFPEELLHVGEIFTLHANDNNSGGQHGLVEEDLSKLLFVRGAARGGKKVEEKKESMTDDDEGDEEIIVFRHGCWGDCEKQAERDIVHPQKAASRPRMKASSDATQKKNGRSCSIGKVSRPLLDRGESALSVALVDDPAAATPRSDGRPQHQSHSPASTAAPPPLLRLRSATGAPSPFSSSQSNGASRGKGDPPPSSGAGRDFLPKSGVRQWYRQGTTTTKSEEKNATEGKMNGSIRLLGLGSSSDIQLGSSEILALTGGCSSSGSWSPAKKVKQQQQQQQKRSPTDCTPLQIEPSKPRPLPGSQGLVSNAGRHASPTNKAVGAADAPPAAAAAAAMVVSMETTEAGTASPPPPPPPPTFGREENLRRVVVRPGAVAVENNGANVAVVDAHAAATGLISAHVVVEQDVVVQPDRDMINDHIDMRVNQRIRERLDELVSADVVVRGEPVVPKEGEPDEAPPTAAPAPPSSKGRLRMILMYCLGVVVPVVVVVVVVWQVVGGQTNQENIAVTTSVSSSSLPTGTPTQSPQFVSSAETGLSPGTLKATLSPTSSQPSSTPAVPSATGPDACIPGRYYYTYEGDNFESLIGYVDLSTLELGSQYASTPDCYLWYLAFDSRGTTYGICRDDPANFLVTVDLSSGKTTKIAEFPSNSYEPLVYNPADDHLYVAYMWDADNNHDDDANDDDGNDDDDGGDDDDIYANDRSGLVRIEKDWTTFTTVGNGSSSMEGLFNGFAIDSHGNAFAVDIRSPAVLHSVDITAGTSVPLGAFPEDHPDCASIAFDGSSTLYGIGYSSSPAPLFAIELSTLGATNSNLTTTRIKDTFANYAEGGAFCPRP